MSYEVVDLGLFQPQRLNNNNVVAGSINGQPAIYENGAARILQGYGSDTKGVARDVNDAGVIVGYSLGTKTLNAHAVIFHRNGSPTLLQSPRRTHTGEANAISNGDKIVGELSNGGCQRAMVFHRSPPPTPLPGDGTALTREAVAVNKSGQVVVSELEGTGVHGCSGYSWGTVYNADGSESPIPAPPGTWGNEDLGGGFTPADINDIGYVVGSYSYCNRTSYPNHCQFNESQWCHNDNVAICGIAGFEDANGTSSPIYSPRTGDACLVLTAINNSDAMVGHICGNGNHADIAIIVAGGTVTELGTVIAPDSGWVLEQAVDISDTGTIVGTGTLDGSVHGYMLLPQ